MVMETDGAHYNKRWGYLSRVGLYGKSYLTRHVEAYADIVTSRVSNLLLHTPYKFYNAHATQPLAHDVLPLE